MQNEKPTVTNSTADLRSGAVRYAPDLETVVGAAPNLRSRNQEKREQRIEHAQRVILIPGYKGGDGKSTFARVLIEMLRRFISGGLAVAAADGDFGVGQTYGFLATRGGDNVPLPEQDPMRGVVGFDFLGSQNITTYAALLALPEDRLVMDLPGNSMGRVIQLTPTINAEVFLDRMDKLKKRVTVVHLISPLIASLAGVNDAVNALGNRVDHLVVRNLGRGRPEDFLIWGGQFTRPDGANPGRVVRERFDAVGGVEIDFPAIPLNTYSLIDAMEISFFDALGYFQDQWEHDGNLRGWLRQVADQFDKVRPMLGMPDDLEWTI